MKFFEVYFSFRFQFEIKTDYVFNWASSTGREMDAIINLYSTNEVQLDFGTHLCSIPGVKMDVILHFISMSD